MPHVNTKSSLSWLIELLGLNLKDPYALSERIRKFRRATWNQTRRRYAVTAKKMNKKGGVREKLFLILTLLYVFDDLVTVAVVGS